METRSLLATSIFARIGFLTSSTAEGTRQDLLQVDTLQTLQWRLYTLELCPYAVLFIAKLNKLKSWGADIGNAYLEAKTKEKVYIIGDEGFGDLHLMYKALYGLKSSGKR